MRGGERIQQARSPSGEGSPAWGVSGERSPDAAHNPYAAPPLRPTSAITHSHHPRNTSGNIPSVIDPPFFPGPQSGPRSRSRGNRAGSGASARGRGGNGQHLPTNHMLKYSNGGAERGWCRVAYYSAGQRLIVHEGKAPWFLPTPNLTTTALLFF